MQPPTNHPQSPRELFIAINDDLVPASRASLLVNDLSIQRGYGVFDFFKTLVHHPVFIDDHLDRFVHSAAQLRLEIGKTRQQLRELIDTLREKNDIPDSGIRLTLTGGYSPDGYTLIKPNLVISQSPLSVNITAECQPGIRLVSYPHQRQLPNVKTIDYLMAIWLQPFIKSRSADDVLYHREGIITECPRSNFFIVTSEDALVTPARHMLKGIIRGKTLQLAKRQFITKERDISLEELQTAKEAFITSTTKHILPVLSVDGQPIGKGYPGKIAQWLHRELYQITRPS